MNSSIPPRHLRAFCWTLLTAAGALAQVAPVAPPPARSGSAPAQVEAVVLSPFEVRAEDDSGYQAANSTNGSRLNSKLKDTPASVSPFTKEFLSDIGATDLESMLAYATNVEREVEDSTNGFNNPPGRDSTGNDFRFRVRGVAGSASVNYAQSGVPVDLYNIERAEMASGPNSILFGLGAPGGTVALSSKFADLRRTHTSTKAVFGSWDYNRFELDHNQILIPRKLGFRLLGLYQDAEGWRKWDLNEQRRITGAFSYQPWAKTAIRGSYQAGNSANNISLPWNAADSLTTWLAAGRPTTDTTVVPTTTSLGTGNRYTLLSQDNLMTNFRSKFFSARAPSTTLVPPALMGYAYNLSGPGGLRTQNFIDYQVKVEQRLTRTLVAEVAYFHNINRILTRGNINPNLFLTGDPNLTITTMSGATLANPHVRQLYLEDNWGRDPFKDINDTLRFSAAWEFNLGKWFGRHRLAGLAESARQDRLRRWENEILADQNNLAANNSATPDGTGNQPWRRRYVTEGQFETYFAADPTQEILPFTSNGLTYHSTFTARTRSNTHTIQDARSLMFASQSYWFKERLVTTLGYRVDQISFDTYGQGRVSDPKDPRYTSGRFVLNAWDFDGTVETNKYRPTTFTAGGVLHVLPRLSLFYNESKNSGTPRLDRTVLPTGKTPPPTEGIGHDYGAMLDVLGDDRLFFRFSAYETQQTKDAAIIPDGLSVNTSTSLGGTAMLNIYNALLAAGRISRDQYDSELKFYNAATIDAITRGWEAEFVANPTKTLTLRLGVSRSDRKRVNFFNEVYSYFAQYEPKWRTAAAGDTALLNTVNQQITTAHENIDAMAALQNNPFGTRPYKANLTARYRFDRGPLKGAFVGGAGRFQSRNLTKYSSIDGRALWGTPTLFADSFAGYRFTLTQRKLPMSVQLNIRNMFNSYLVGIGRYNAAENGYLRVYLNEPRSYRLSLTADY
jgi:outer membrane receptor protein involved in Fe transport